MSCLTNLPLASRPGFPALDGTDFDLGEVLFRGAAFLLIEEEPVLTLPLESRGRLSSSSMICWRRPCI